MAERMRVATRDFLAEYDGDLVQIRAGRDRVHPEHDLAMRFPENFEPATGMASRVRSVARVRTPDGRVAALDLPPKRPTRMVTHKQSYHSGLYLLS
jgi:hypothetical protein